MSEIYVLLSSIVIALLAILGNTFVCYVILRENMRSTVYRLIFSQCLSDLMYGAQKMLALMVCRQAFAMETNCQLRTCELTRAFGASMYAVSSLSIACIAIDRWLKVKGVKVTRRTICVLICCIWLVGLTSGFTGIVGRRSPFNFVYNDTLKCFTIFEGTFRNYDFFNQHYAFWINTVVLLYFPLTTASILYPVIIHKTRQIEKQISQHSRQLTTQKAIKRRRTIKMLIAIVISYYLLNIPVFLMVKLSVITQQQQMLCDQATTGIITTVFIQMYLLSTCVNPFIICYFNPVFKNYLCAFGAKSERQRRTSETTIGDNKEYTVTNC